MQTSWVDKMNQRIRNLIKQANKKARLLDEDSSSATPVREKRCKKQSNSRDITLLTEVKKVFVMISKVLKVT